MAEAPAAAPAAPAADPKAAPAVPAATPEPTEDYIVSGKAVKLTKAQAKAYIQKGLFADQKLKSIDTLKTTSEKLLAALKTPDGIMGLLRDPALGTSPKEVLRKLMASDVIDDELKEEIAKWTYQNVVVPGKKTPEEVERDKKLTDYERLKKEETARKQADLTKQQQAQVAQVYAAVRSEVTKQVVADKTFPQTEGAIRAVVEKLRVMNRKGAPISPENVTKALGLVKKDHLLHQQTMFDAIEDPEALIALFGEARALKISKALVARLKAKGAAKPAEGAKPASTGGRDSDSKQFGRERHGYKVMDVF